MKYVMLKAFGWVVVVSIHRKQEVKVEATGSEWAGVERGDALEVTP